MKYLSSRLTLLQRVSQTPRQYPQKIETDIYILIAFSMRLNLENNQKNCTSIHTEIQACFTWEDQVATPCVLVALPIPIVFALPQLLCGSLTDLKALCTIPST